MQPSLLQGYEYFIFDEDSMDIETHNIGRIEERFPGIPHNIEAAVRLLDGYIYFFKGERYVSLLK